LRSGLAALKRKAEKLKVSSWEGEKGRGALRLRSTSFEERPGGLEKKGGKTEGESGSWKWECGSGNLEVGSRKAEKKEVGKVRRVEERCA
jgi:hypothetical protein